MAKWSAILAYMRNEEPRGKPRGINTKFKPADLQSALRRKRRGIRPGGIQKSRRRAHVAAVGMAVHDGHHGKGVGSALMKAALDLADNWLQYTRLELTVYTDNAAALALYKKFGFEIEGTHRQFAFRNGAHIDSYSMARLRNR